MKTHLELIDCPLVYEDSPNIPEEHKEKVRIRSKEIDQERIELDAIAERCYNAKTVDELSKSLEGMEFGVREAFFCALASRIPTDLDEGAVLRDFAMIAYEDPKKAAEWCAAIDPRYGTAYAIGWIRIQQERIAHGLPNDVTRVAKQLDEEKQAKHLQLTDQTVSGRVLGTAELVLDTAARFISNLRSKTRHKKEKNHG